MFKNNFCLIAICVGILFVNQAHSDGDCSLQKPDGSFLDANEWKFQITLPGKISDESLDIELLNYKAQNISKIKSYETNTVSNLKYIEAELIGEKDNKNFTIKLTNNFTHFEEYEVGAELMINVSFECTTDERTLQIRQDIEDLNNHKPTFFNDPYTYTLQMPLQKNFLIDSQRLISARDIDITNKNITFTLDSDEKAKGFSAIWVARDEKDLKKFYGNLLTTDVIDLDEDVTFRLYATDAGIPPNTVSTPVTIKVDSANSSPKFSKSFYKADLKNLIPNTNTKIPIKFDNPIKIVRGVEQNAMLSFVCNNSDYDKYFTHSTSIDFSEISLELNNPPKELLNEKFLILELTVKKVRSSATTILYIELPGMLVPGDEDKSKLNFTNALYRVDKDDLFTGFMIKEEAILIGGKVEDVITYRCNITNKDLEKKISINSGSGEVTITEALTPGFYIFEIIAEVKNLNLAAKAEVLLIISSTEMEFEYALQIIEVEEESEHPKLLSLGNETCTYDILSEAPSKDLFYITNNFLSSKKIDRESSIFSNMLSAQVRLVVQATCSKKSFVNQRRAKRDAEYDVLVENIPFTRSQMQIVAMITDINDNPPIWDTKIPKVIGYPTKDLSKFVVPPSVYSLSATDADIGKNAHITYSLNNSSSFYIHPEKGTLYVRKGVPIDKNLTAIASDGLHETPLEISIQMLNDNNIVALYLKNSVIEDVESILLKLSTTMQSTFNCWIGSIGAAVISDNENSLDSRIASKDSNEAKTLLRVLVYGIDLKSTSAVESSVLKSGLEKSGTSSGSWSISKISTLDEILPPQSNDSGPTNNSYKVATIILSLIIAVAVIGFVVYMIKYRRFTIFV